MSVVPRVSVAVAAVIPGQVPESPSVVQATSGKFWENFGVRVKCQSEFQSTLALHSDSIYRDFLTIHESS